jgi:hypothetical protein
VCGLIVVTWGRGSEKVLLAVAAGVWGLLGSDMVVVLAPVVRVEIDTSLLSV